MTILSAGLINKRHMGHDCYLVTLSLVQALVFTQYKMLVVPNSSGNVILHTVKHVLHTYFLENGR